MVGAHCTASSKPSLPQGPPPPVIQPPRPPPASSACQYKYVAVRTVPCLAFPYPVPRSGLHLNAGTLHLGILPPHPARLGSASSSSCSYVVHTATSPPEPPSDPARGHRIAARSSSTSPAQTPCHQSAVGRGRTPSLTVPFRPADSPSSPKTRLLLPAPALFVPQPCRRPSPSPPADRRRLATTPRPSTARRAAPTRARPRRPRRPRAQTQRCCRRGVPVC